jgi:hypothetical protein
MKDSPEIDGFPDGNHVQLPGSQMGFYRCGIRDQGVDRDKDARNTGL